MDLQTLATWARTLLEWLLSHAMAGTQEAIGVAAIHATVLSIIIAAFTLYVSIFYQKQLEIEHRVKVSADKINRHEPPVTLGAPPKENWNQLLTRFSQLAVGIAPQPGTSEDLAGEGFEVLHTLTALTHYYPFAAWIGQEGEVLQRLRVPERIEFQSVQQIKQWVSDLQTVIEKISWDYTLHANHLQSVVDAYNQKRLANSAGPDLTQSPEFFWKVAPTGSRVDLTRSIDLGKIGQQAMFRNLLQYIFEARPIMQSVQEELGALEVVMAMRPNNVLPSIVCAGIVLVFGVVTPIAVPNPPKLLAIWIPVLIYLLAFGFLSQWLIQKARSPR